MRSFKRVMCALGGQEEYERKIRNALPVSPQDDHVIEFAKQFGWDCTWMEKQAKKKGKKKELEDEAARQSRDVGDMLGAVSRGTASGPASASASQVTPHDVSSQAQVLPSQAPQVKAPPAVKATPPAPPMELPVVERPADTPPPPTPVGFVTPPPPNRRRRARSEESEVASRDDRLAVIARTAQSKSFAVHVAPTPPSDDTFQADLEAELSREDAVSREHEPSHEQQGSNEASREYQTCVICFEPCNPLDQDYPLEALPCAHVFHVACLSAWRETVRITDRHRCPNGCHRVHVQHPFWGPYQAQQSSQVNSRDDEPDVIDVPRRAPEFEEDENMSPGDVAFL